MIADRPAVRLTNGADLEDDDAYGLAWAAMLRLLDRTCPECQD